MTPHRKERLQSVTVTAQCIYFLARLSCNVFAIKDLPHLWAGLFRDHPGIPRAYSHSDAQFPTGARMTRGAREMNPAVAKLNQLYGGSKCWQLSDGYGSRRKRKT
jgi:hypothetical protein